MARKEFAGAAPQTTLSGSMTAGSPTSGGTFTVASGTGYPTGAYAGGFVVVVDAGTSSEEKILCSARSGTTFTVATSGRGFDGTSAAAHGGGTTTGTINHSIDADTFTDYGGHVYDTTRDDHTQYQKSSLLTTQGDIPYATAASTWARLAKGAAWRALAMNQAATAPTWASGYPLFVFADATARDAAITSPTEGQFAWLTGTDALTYYTGSAWAAFTGTTTTLVGAKAIRSATLTVNDTTETAIPFTAADEFDTNTMHDTVTTNTRITIAAGKTGYYLLNGQLDWSTAPSNSPVLSIKKNATTLLATAQAPVDSSRQISVVVNLTAADYVDLRIYHSSGGTRDVASASFSAVLLGV